MMSWFQRLFEPGPGERAGGNASRVCTLSFTNMTGYVGIAERMPLEKLPVFMNQYFEVQTEVIQAREGIIDKYIGDVIVAIWTQAQVDAQLACESALDQLAAMADFYSWATRNGFPSPGIRIGINSGLMHIGEFGTEVRRNYTVMGDEVNLASRMEGLTTQYGVQLLISASTRQRLSQDMVVRPVDRVRVKGREGHLDIFELVCRKADLSPEKAMFLERYQKGFDEYLGGHFADAIDSLGRAQELVPADGPSEVLIARCRQSLREPHRAPT